MKTLKEYLSESKKVYPFKVKVAGDLPEDFQKTLKERLGSCNPAIVEKSKTPIQAKPLDFPTLSNLEVHTFEVVCEYPITAPEIADQIKSLIPESHFRVRNGGDPGETEHSVYDIEPTGKSLLEDPKLGVDNHKSKDYFGDNFNTSFLRDLSRASKQRKKEDSKAGEYKVPTVKPDKAGLKSPLGSNK